MRQFLTAFAALLATTTTAAPDEAAFKIETTFSDEDFVFLSIEQDNPVTLKLPKTYPPDDMCLECPGWQLADPEAEYIDFTVEAIVVGKRTKFLFTGVGATEVTGELVEFENTCNVDGEGAP